MACKDYNVAGLRKRVTIQRSTRVSDGQGGYTETWAAIASVWSAIEPVSGFEKLQAMQLAAPVTHKITMRFRSDFVASDRIAYGNRIFAVKEIINLNEADAFLQIRCIEQT